MSTRSSHALCALGVALLLASPAAAIEDPPLDDPVCAISTCRLGPSLSADADAVIDVRDDCPVGHACVCVPSCPECDDCAAQVCVADPGNECRTACDCPPGLGCFDGQCIAGVAPVFCCEGDVCPANEQCQHRDGRRDRCADPMCMERVRKVTHHVEALVERAGYCNIDRDCVRIDTSTECVGTCGAFINRRHVEAVSQLIDRFDHAICDGFQEDGCPYATPACLATRGKCIENRCEAVPILPGPGPGPRITPQALPDDGVLRHLQPAAR